MYGADNIIALCKQIYPYMRCAVKRERARMLIDEWRKTTFRNGYYTAERRAAKAEFETRFLALGEGRGKRCIVGQVGERLKPAGCNPAP